MHIRNNTVGMFIIRIGYPDLVLPIRSCMYQALEALARKLLFGTMVCFSLCDGAILYAPTSTRSTKQRVTTCEASGGSTYIGGHDTFHISTGPTDFDTSTYTTNDHPSKVHTLITTKSATHASHINGSHGFSARPDVGAVLVAPELFVFPYHLPDADIRC